MLLRSSTQSWTKLLPSVAPAARRYSVDAHELRLEDSPEPAVKLKARAPHLRQRAGGEHGDRQRMKYSTTSIMPRLVSEFFGRPNYMRLPLVLSPSAK